MISEPELVGEEEPPGRSQFPGGAIPGQRDPDVVLDVVLSPDAEPRPRPPLRAWLWALGGAVTASAVWAGGLYAHSGQDPDVGDYRVSRNLCLDAGMKAVSTVLGPVGTREPLTREHPTRDFATCSLTFENPDQQQRVEFMPAGVFIEYTLHRRTDPGPEFDAAASADSLLGRDPVTLERVEGLGERAYLLKGGDGLPPSLYVLDGQAVLSMSLSEGGPMGPDSEGTPPDISGIRPFMIDDMGALMD
ncbi:hypothetical protein ACWF94_39395, partial [Streptomyces sp. NPDC055078]